MRRIGKIRGIVVVCHDLAVCEEVVRTVFSLCATKAARVIAAASAIKTESAEGNCA